MRISLQWLSVVLAATAIDLLARFGGSFSFHGVLWVEAFLFPATGVGLLFLLRKAPRLSGFKRTFQVVLIVSFFLAGLRSGLWASGLPVGTANLLVLAGAILTWIGSRVSRRRLEGKGEPAGIP